MNGWDLVTWLSAAGLALGSVAIFGLFLRDARSVFRHEGRERDRGE